MPKEDLFEIANYYWDYLVPRCLGLHSIRYDSNTDQFVSSRLWLTVCNVIGFLFIGMYPIAINEIVKHRPLREQEDHVVGRIMIYLHFINLYVLSVSVFIRQMWFSKSQMHSMNRCLKLYRQCKTLSDENMDLRQIYLFVLRCIYSYFGYILVNCLSLFYFYNDLSNVNLIYKSLFFVPHIVIITTPIRFHLGAMHLTICGRRIYREFSRCIEQIKVTNNEPTDEFEQVCASVMDRFDYLTWFHAEWYEVARLMEKGLSLLMLLIVTSTLNSLTTSVIEIIVWFLMEMK